MTPDEALLARIKERGEYEHVRMLEDGTIIGLGRLMYTVALFVNMDLTGYEKRYCFKDPALAVKAYQTMQKGDDEPEGWIARRPEPEGFYDLPKE
jgi:hypothetical protein